MLKSKSETNTSTNIQQQPRKLSMPGNFGIGLVGVFQFYPDSSFGKFVNFGLGTIESERVKLTHF